MTDYFFIIFIAKLKQLLIKIKVRNFFIKFYIMIKITKKIYNGKC